MSDSSSVIASPDAPDAPAPRERPVTSVVSFDGLVGSVRGAPRWAWPVLAVAAVVSAVVLHVFVAWSAVAPAFPYDEVTLLEFARLISGTREGDPVGGAGYFPGWSVLIAPLWWFSTDPVVLYRAVIAMGIVASIATIWPLALLARRWGLGTWPAVAVAGVVMCLPARVVQAEYVFSERLLFLLVVLLVLAAGRFADRPTYVSGILVALTAAAAVFSHARAIPVAGVVGIWLLLRIRRSTRHVIVAGVALVVFTVLAVGVSWWLNRVLVVGHFGQTGGFLDNLRNTSPSSILTVLLGQSWYQMVSTLGLVVIGSVVVVVLAWREVRRREVSDFTLVFGLAAGLFALSVIAWCGEFNLFLNPWRRLDAWIYGRYFDPFAELLVLLALVAIVRGVRRHVVVWSLAISAAVIVPVLFWVAPRAPTWGFVTPAHIPGILPWSGMLPTTPFAEGAWIIPTFTNENRFWLWASLCALVALAAMLVLRSWPAITTALLITAFTVGSVLSNPATDEFQRTQGGIPPIAAAMHEVVTLTGASHVWLAPCDVGTVSGAASGKNKLFFWLQPAAMQDLPAGVEPDGLVVACADWPEGEAAGALPVEGGSGYSRQLWVMPGELQDELESAGLVTP